MLTIIRKILSLPWVYKGKILVFLLMTGIYLVILFPLNDLSDYVSNATRNATQGFIAIEFEDLHLSFSPLPGIRVSKALAEIGNFSALVANEIGIYPALSAVISQAPYGTIKAEGLFRGDINISVNKGNRTEDGISKYEVVIRGESLALEEIRNWARLPMNLKGKMEVKSIINADPTMKESPEAEVTIVINNFDLPSFPLMTEMGVFTMPQLKFSKLELNGRLTGGKIFIDTGKLGSEKDELFGTVKGNMGLALAGGPQGLSPQFGGYTVDLDLKMKKAFESRLSLFLNLIGQYRSEAGGTAQYKFKVSSASMNSPPRFNAQ